MDINRVNEIIQDKKAHEKLSRKIKRQFDTCRYIGDIPINEEEYVLLKWHLRQICRKYLNTTEKYIVSPLFAVALVQIGMRHYDGKFWPYVEKEINIELPGTHQKWIGRSFFHTLRKHNKYVVAENEMMNNILLHCFITEHYAADLFDFLFAYYQIDLERDLSRNNKDMRNYLMQSMAKGENTARAYKIKKHTSDAVSANERGCKIRVGKILRFMDKALFDGIYPTTSQNRIAQMFCKWAETSKKFDHAKKTLAGLTKKGEKRFSKPYLRFNGNERLFNIILPPQYIHLASDEDIPELVWNITYAGMTQSITAEAEGCVTGCKTQKTSDIVIPAEYIHEKIAVELLKNNDERVHNFYISASSIRFFDNEWDLINYDDHLPIGQAFAFVKRGSVLISDSDSTIFDCEQLLGLDLYSLDLCKGDILRLPDGKAIAVGKTLEEGIINTHLTSGAYVMDGESKLAIYSAVPSLYFKMNQSQENGTLILVNDKPHRFDIEKCIKCSAKDKLDERGYILKLADYIENDGMYRIVIDIPGSRKIHDYTFSVIKGFSFEYEGAPYIFKDAGTIRFNGDYSVIGGEQSTKLCDRHFSFDIQPDVDYLPFSIKAGDAQLQIRVYLPAFKWKFDDGNWYITKPENIWHTEFPKFIYLKFPDDTVVLDMPPLLTDDSEDEENDYSITVTKSKEQHMFVCDTRKIMSWFGFEEIIRPLSLHFDSCESIRFVNIITRCFIANDKLEVVENRDKMQLWFKCDVLGFSDCVADIYRNGELIAEKVTLYANGVKEKIPFVSGRYRIDFFEADEEDDFGYADYRKFDSKTCQYINKRDLTGKAVMIKEFVEHGSTRTIFRSPVYSVEPKVYITDITSSLEEADAYYGILTVNDQEVKVKFKFQKPDSMSTANIWFWSEDDEEYIEFLYDKQTHKLLIAEDETIPSSQARTRYIIIFSDEYHYNVQVK